MVDQGKKSQKSLRKTNKGIQSQGKYVKTSHTALKSRILVVSDLHVPYHHPDSFNFLEHLASKYNPPKMVLLESNHGSMVLRRAMAKGMSKFFLKDYNEILDVGTGWKWKEHHWEETPLGRVYFAHQVSKNIVKSVQTMSASVVQGHYHTQSNIEYVGNDFHLNWGMSVGCLVDKKSLAMAYMKINLAKPVLSCGVITDGVPSIVPMLLKQDGSWDGKIYL